MPTLSYYCLVYTDGRAPSEAAAREADFLLTPLSDVPVPGPEVELFGPHALAVERGMPNVRAAWLLHGRRVSRDADAFFALAHQVVARAVEGLDGWAVDVLKLWPFPLGAARELPEEPLAEDLFSVAIYERGGDAYRAETHGLAKLGQKEIGFTFRGRDLADEAALLCAHLADYVMTHGRPVDAGQSVSFGYDRIAFFEPEGRVGDLRAHHPEFVRRVLDASLFPGVGALEVKSFVPMSDQPTLELTDALARSHEQRQVLESLELAGEPPHHLATARHCICADASKPLRAFRDEPESVRDSGWTFLCDNQHRPSDIAQGPLGVLVARLPQIFRYLALPPGCTVEWRGGEVVVDAGAVDDPIDDDSRS